MKGQNLVISMDGVESEEYAYAEWMGMCMSAVLCRIHLSWRLQRIARVVKHCL